MAMLNIHRVISFVTNDDRDILSPRHGCNTTIDNFGKVLAHVIQPLINHPTNHQTAGRKTQGTYSSIMMESANPKAL